MAGGAETLLKNLGAYLHRQGDEVHFLTTCATDPHTWENDREAGEETHDGISVHYFPVDETRDLETFLRIQDDISRGQNVKVEQQRQWMANSVHSPALYEYMEANPDRYDALIVGPYLFGLCFHAAQLLPEKTWLLPCLHDEPFAKLDIMHELFHAVHHILFNAAPEQDLANRLYNIPSSKGSIVGMGLDRFDVDPGAYTKRSQHTRPYVLYSGRREGLKGTPVLTAFMHAFMERTGREVDLVFTGSGTIEADADLWPYITDLGFVSEQEKHEVMAGALAFIHPSVNESFGIVLMEAWLAGTPVLVHGKSDVLRHQCEQSNGGLWFHTYPEFEAALELLLDNQALRTTLATNGRNYVQTAYTWEAVGTRLVKALDA